MKSIEDGLSQSLVPVFVYGTLRLGQCNYPLAEKAVTDVVIDCTTKGCLYFVVDDWGFPVAKLDEPGTIIGDILWFDSTHPNYGRVVDMELGAGYKLVQIVAQDRDGKDIECFAFHYPHIPRGHKIVNGDWIAGNSQIWSYVEDSAFGNDLNEERIN